MPASAIDIGSTAVRAATGLTDSVAFAAEPHVYVELPDDEGSRRLVERFGLHPAPCEGRLVVSGSEAAELASSLGRPPESCFARGTPAESRFARAATRAMAARLLGPGGGRCVFAAPAAAGAHLSSARAGASAMGAIIAALGYEPEAVFAPAAAALGALGPGGTGLVIHVGQAFSHMALAISGALAGAATSTKAGEAIDAEAADALGVTVARVRAVREQAAGSSPGASRTREEEAVAVYLRTAVAHLVTALRERGSALAMAAEAAGGELPVVLTGGFTRTPISAEAVGAELEPIRRHAPLGAPSVAREPELAVLRGCAILAASAGAADGDAGGSSAGHSP